MVSLKAIIITASTMAFAGAIDLPWSKNFNQMYVFGDSLSDFGNTFALSNFTKPDPKYYNKGRYSNGPTWVEHLAQNLKITNIKSFAYAGATSDNIKFQSKLVNGGVPGALQQVDLFDKYYNSQKLDFFKCSKTLVTFGFGGNDFEFPEATPFNVMDNLKKSIRKLASGYGLKYFAILVGAPLDLSPKTKALPELYQKKLQQVELALELMWDDAIKELNKNFPNISIYKVNSRDDFLKVASGKEKLDGISPWNSVKPCLTRTFDPNGHGFNATFCDNSKDYMFWDELHPTTRIHKYVADELTKRIH